MWKNAVRRTNSSTLLLAVVLTALILVVKASIGLAQSSGPTNPSDDQVNVIAKQLYCPVCENIPLDVCGTQACAQWRELIREKLGQGWSEAQIKQYFVDQYGDRVLATPPARGLNWLVYLVPPVVILAGVYILYRAFQSWKQPVTAADEPGRVSGLQTQTSQTDEYVRQLEEELRKR